MGTEVTPVVCRRELQGLCHKGNEHRGSRQTYRRCALNCGVEMRVSMMTQQDIPQMAATNIIGYPGGQASYLRPQKEGEGR